jgi:hypothetical protein
MQLSGPVAGCSNDAPGSDHGATVVRKKNIIITD